MTYLWWLCCRLAYPVEVHKPDGKVTRIRFHADDPRHAATAITQVP